MKKYNPRIIAVLVLTVGFILTVQVSLHAATITGSYPGYPGTWEGLTTNTTIEIALDTAVAMVGPAPDITYCVKKAELSGLDFVFTDVPCTVDVSADRKTIILYPNDMLGANGMYAYKIETINFEGGGAEQDYARYFESGDNPIPQQFALEVDAAAMCSDEAVYDYYCVRCHTDYVDLYPFIYGVCVIAP